MNKMGMVATDSKDRCDAYYICLPILQFFLFYADLLKIFQLSRPTAVISMCCNLHFLNFLLIFMMYMYKCFIDKCTVILV